MPKKWDTLINNMCREKEQSEGGHEEGTLMNDAASWSESEQIAETLKEAKSWSIIQNFLVKFSHLFWWIVWAFLLEAFLSFYGYFSSLAFFRLLHSRCPFLSIFLSFPLHPLVFGSPPLAALLRPLWLFLSQRKPLNANRRFLSSVCSMQSHLFGNGHLPKWRWIND